MESSRVFIPFGSYRKKNFFLKLLVVALFVATAVLVIIPRPLVSVATITELQVTTEPEWIGGKRETLTRIGSDLRFRVEKCPPDSLMRSEFLLQQEPLHSDCPTLFIVGTIKGGTTSMLQYVSKHEDFEGAKLKVRHIGLERFEAGEIHYFDKALGRLTWEQYKAFFPTGVVTGESSATYLSSCKVPKSIFQYCGRKAKVVMLFRNPISRIISHYVMAKIVKTHKFDLSIDEYIWKNLNRYNQVTIQKPVINVTQEWGKQRCITEGRGSGIITFGMYYVQLMNWLCNFPAENIMIINSEEFRQNTPRIVGQVISFLGLRPLSEESYASINATTYNKGDYRKFNTQMSSKTLATLQELYQPHNKALLELLKWTNSTEWYN